MIVAAISLGCHRLDVGRPGDRRGDRCVHPAAGVASRSRGPARAACRPRRLALDIPALQRELATISGVVDVHDIHVWTLTSEMEVATAHLMVSVGTDSHAVLDQARQLLADQHGITHATLAGRTGRSPRLRRGQLVAGISVAEGWSIRRPPETCRPETSRSGVIVVGTARRRRR